MRLFEWSSESSLVILAVAGWLVAAGFCVSWSRQSLRVKYLTEAITKHRNVVRNADTLVDKAFADSDLYLELELTRTDYS